MADEIVCGWHQKEDGRWGCLRCEVCQDAFLEKPAQCVDNARDEASRSSLPNGPSSSQSREHALMEEVSKLRFQNDALRSRYKNSLVIVVDFVHPPIPIRTHDWLAHYDDAEGSTGEGSTPYMAILDLINNANPTDHLDSLRRKPK